MSKKIYLSFLLTSVLLLTSCSGKFAPTSDFFKVTPDVLVSQGGKVQATVDGNFPAKSFPAKAIVTITPVLKYEGGETLGTPVTLQGAKVKANNKVIGKEGGAFSVSSVFDYKPEMSKSELYLRPETAQGIFVNFANIQRTTRKKVPSGVAQVGKSFRNEITPGNFIFRVREFEQMELEFFCKPGTDLEWFEYWRGFCRDWLYSLNIKEENLRLRDHAKEELCFYSKATTDFEYLFPFGWGELWGVADRTDYDLTQHSKTSGKTLEYFDPTTNEKYIPYVIEPSLGVERLFLALVVEAYDEEVIDEKDTRVVLRLHPTLAPYKACVLPLSKKLNEQAGKVYEQLSADFMTDYDDAGSIGKRYRRQDEIGTPFCITYDFESVDDGCVTVRDRDTMQQERVAIDKLNDYIAEKIKF